MTLRLNGSSSGYVELTPPAAAGSNTLTLPTSNGSAKQYLRNSATPGTLEFATLPLSEVAFEAHLSAQQTIPDSTYTTVLCDDVTWNLGSAYNSSTGEFTVPSGKDGRYMFGYSTRLYDIDTDEVAQARLYKNGSHKNVVHRWRSQLQAFKSNVYVYLSTSNVVDLVAGDIIKFVLHQDTGTDAVTPSYYTSFWGMKIQD